MADDLQLSIAKHKLQLEQVEAALTNDPGNDELLKLKSDLEEVLQLTQNLLEAQVAGEEEANFDDSELAEPDTSNPLPPRPTTYDWSVGDKCTAVWADDGKEYDAVIDAITDDGMVSVTFESYGNTDVTTLSQLKPYVGRVKQLKSAGLDESSKGARKRKVEEERALAKKKKQKKLERRKQMEEQHDKEKAKWLNFASKKSKLKGVVKKSIFATPDSASGRVGIGTCNMGGRAMTQYTHAEKWRKGT